MSSRVDTPNEPQKPLDNQYPFKSKKKWHGRDIQKQVQTKQVQANQVQSNQIQADQKKFSAELETPTSSTLEDKKISQSKKGADRKRARKDEPSFIVEGEDHSSKKTRTKALRLDADQKEGASSIEHQQHKEMQNPEMQLKLDQKIFFDHQVVALESEYQEQQQTLHSLSKRVYFEAAKDEHLISIISHDEYTKLDFDLGWSRAGLQLLITEKKISDYCDQQPKELQKKLHEIFQPILDTLQRSKKCFLSYDLLYKNHPPEAHAHLLKQIVLSIEQAIHNVPIGQSILIPAGYSIHEAGGGGRGHIVHLVFTRTSETSFKLEVYNTGDGVVLHLCSETVPKKYYPKVYQEIDSSKLSKDFFSKIAHLMYLEEGEVNTDTLPHILYLTLEKELGVVENPEVTRKEKPYQDQGLIARCTYSPLSRYVHNALKDHEDVYAEYKLYTTATLITQYTKQLNEEISSESIDKIETLSKNLFEKLQVLGEELLEDRKQKIEWISCPKRADPQFMLDQVQKNGLFLRFGSEEIRKNMTVAKAAVHNNPKAIYYVHPDLQKDPYFKDHISNRPLSKLEFLSQFVVD